MLTKNINLTLFYVQLPLFCAVLLEAHIHFLWLRATSANEYMLIVGQTLIESLPFFITHHFAHKAARQRAIFIWLLGFLCYPLLSLVMNSQSAYFSDWSLLGVQGWLLTVFASAAWFVNRVLKERNKTRSLKFIYRLFSLNIVVTLLLVGWAIAMAGIFNSAQDPLGNKFISAVIDITNIFDEFGGFIGFLWQFLLLAALIGGIYILNRYGLIRQILAKQGALAFVSCALISIIIMTPVAASLILWLPLNNPVFTLFPLQNYHIFSPVNYQLLFWIFAISTPLILVFERQQQDAALARIAQQQTYTELKLLQQQINPHFLFNTLNNLYALTLTKSDDAPNLVVKLSNLLRYTVYEGQKEQVTLAQEVSYLKDFVALQEIRSHDRCTLDLKWPEQDDKFTIPPLLIIMLLENAFKFGVEPTIEKSHLRFHMQLSKNILTVVCENPIFTKTQESVGGMGLENLRRRLILLYPGKHTLTCGPKGKLWYAKMTLELAPC